MEKSLQDLINKLHTYSTKLHMFHWNVTGRDFLSFHAFFEEAYSELTEQKDTIAEYLRFKGFTPMIELDKASSFAKDFKMPEKAEGMFEIALKDFKDLLNSYESLKPDKILEAVISEILPKLEKRIYFMSSILN